MTTEERRIVVNIRNYGQSYRQIAKIVNKTLAAGKVGRAYPKHGQFQLLVAKDALVKPQIEQIYELWLFFIPNLINT